MLNEILPTKEQILEEAIPDDLRTYCMEVADDEEVWKKLASLTGADAVKAQVLYCINVGDREEIWKALLNTPPDDPVIVEHLALYLLAVEDRPEIRKHIVTSKCFESFIQDKNKTEDEAIIRRFHVELVNDPALDKPIDEAYKEYLQHTARCITECVDEWLEDNWTPAIQKCLRKVIPKWKNKWDAIELTHKQLAQIVLTIGSKILTALRKDKQLDVTLVQGKETLDEYFFTPHLIASALLEFLQLRNIIRTKLVSSKSIIGDVLESKKNIAVINGVI